MLLKKNIREYVKMWGGDNGGERSHSLIIKDTYHFFAIKKANPYISTGEPMPYATAARYPTAKKQRFHTSYQAQGVTAAQVVTVALNSRTNRVRVTTTAGVATCRLRNAANVVMFDTSAIPGRDALIFVGTGTNTLEITNSAIATLGISQQGFTHTIPVVVAPAFDPDAQTFFTTAGITDPTQQAAVSALVVGLKANGTWSKYHAIYPFVGGTASRHSFNLKNPATFQITWGGTVTHDANGITGDGSTGYGSTGYTPSVSATLGSNSVSLYCRTAKAATQTIEMGCGAAGEWGLALRYPSDECYPMLQEGGQYPSVILAATTGWILASRNNMTTVQGYRNGGLVLDAAQTQNAINGLNTQIAVLASRNETVWNRFSPVNLALVNIGLGLTAGEITADYTTIQAFQTALGRQV